MESIAYTYRHLLALQWRDRVTKAGKAIFYVIPSLALQGIVVGSTIRLIKKGRKEKIKTSV